MYVDSSQFGGQDRLRVNLRELYEVEYWSMRFRVTPEQLAHAVSEVGPIAADVQDYLVN
jgi:hypothetical protein